MAKKVYDYPVYGTQGGGLVRRVAAETGCEELYIFVEKPNCPSLDVGDMMPKEWGIAPANDHASREITEEMFV